MWPVSVFLWFSGFPSHNLSFVIGQIKCVYSQQIKDSCLPCRVCVWELYSVLCTHKSGPPRQSTEPNFLNGVKGNKRKLGQSEKEFTGCIEVKALHLEVSFTEK